MNEQEQRARRIAELNDMHRKTLTRCYITSGVQALPESTLTELMKRVRAFNSWDENNDPHGEHDMGWIEVPGEPNLYVWKIDYYDLEMENGSEDPADPAQTVRVMTVMKSEEY